jgi:hypothetical protein
VSPLTKKLAQVFGILKVMNHLSLSLNCPRKKCVRSDWKGIKGKSEGNYGKKTRHHLLFFLFKSPILFNIKIS